MLNLFDGAPVIYAYTRAQAIDDGVLVDVSATAVEAGIRYPVALTCRVWNEIVEPDEESAKQGQDAAGRLWDVLCMFRHGALGSPSGDTLIYGLYVVRDGRQEFVSLKAVCGPGDTAEPVITIMFPDED